jgi:hypothetical protein
MPLPGSAKGTNTVSQTTIRLGFRAAALAQVFFSLETCSSHVKAGRVV